MISVLPSPLKSPTNGVSDGLTANHGCQAPPMPEVAAPGTTTIVMLWAGTVSARLLPETARSGRRLIALAEVSCQREALPRGLKPASDSVTVVEPDSTLLITTTVNAPSAARTAAKADSSSGLGTAALTLVSPKAPPLPS